MTDDRRYQLVQGTLEMLILRTLQAEATHGHGIATRIFQASGELLEVDHGSLYPALQRLQRKGLIRSEWGVSENNRRARYYSLTAGGRRQLEEEADRWRRLTEAIAGIMEAESLAGEA